MAGSFGHEVEHYEVARAVASTPLPAVRQRGDAEIASRASVAATRSAITRMRGQGM